MSTSEDFAARVLLVLWRRGDGRAVPMDLLARETGARMPLVLEGLDLLARRGCLIERSPLGAELISVGLACWRGVLEDEAGRRGGGIGRRVEVLARTASTSDIAWQAAEETHGLVVLADEQTAGRGRRGRLWHAKAGQSVLMSILLHGMEFGALDRLTLLAGLAAAEGIERAAGHADMRVEIRWPNDLQFGARKLGGILVETRNIGTEPSAVVGIGINVSQGPGDFPPEVTGRAVSLFQAQGILVDRLRVAARVIEALDRRLATHDDVWMEKWKSRCGLLGRRIRARVGEQEVAGMVVDVDPLQGLVLRDDGGGTQFLSAQRSSLLP